MLTIYLLGVAFFSGMLADDLYHDIDVLTLSMDDVILLGALTLGILCWPVWVSLIIGMKLYEYIAKPI